MIHSKYGIDVKNDGTIIGRSGNAILGEIDKDGYRRISVSYNQDGIIIRKHKFVHRLVAEMFLENFSEDLVVNHKDCDKLNNNLYNLEMVTIKENTRHAIENGLCPHMVGGESCKFTVHSDKLVSQIYEELKYVKRYSNGNIKAGELQKIADKLGTTRFVVKNYSRSRKTRTYLSSATTIPEVGVDPSGSKC